MRDHYDSYYTKKIFWSGSCYGPYGFGRFLVELGEYGTDWRYTVDRRAVNCLVCIRRLVWEKHDDGTQTLKPENPNE